MNLLLTGGAGFIGSNVIRRLIDKPEIEHLVNLDCLTYAGHLENLSDMDKHPKYAFEKVDLRDKSATFEALRRHGISHVLHLAAESHVDRSITGPGDFIQTNVIGTFNLLEACRELWLGSTGVSPKTSGQPRMAARMAELCPPFVPLFLHISTDEVYGSLGPGGTFTESTPYAPNSPYAASKAASDMLVRAYNRTYGLPTITTNCSNNYGPYQHPEKLIPVVIQSILAQNPIPVYGDGTNVRDWLDVRDHADALWLVLCKGKVGEAYNIGSHNEWSNLRLVELICDLMDELAPHRAANSRQLIQFVQDRPGHDRRYAIDASKIERELGWKPAHEFQSGLRETVQWYLENQAWIRIVSGGHPSAERPPAVQS
jgi:dTDP-glucose 4,6-dehydratase